MMRCEIAIASLADRDQWDRWSADSGIASHAWSYNEALVHAGVTPMLAHVRSGDGVMVIPFFERRFGGTADICSVQSVSGASLQGSPAGLLEAFAAHARGRNWVSGYLQFEPHANLAGVAGARPGNRVFLVRVDRSNPLGAASAIIRRKQRRAEASGARLAADKAVLAHPLLSLYRATIQRAQARAIYALPDATLTAWLQSPGTLALGAWMGDEISAVVIFIHRGRHAEYHIGASSREGRHLSAWLLGHGMQRLRDMGVEVLNLGGGVRDGDGLHDFKAKFGGEERPLQILRQVYDREVYERLCREAGAAAGEGWFPAYRAAEARKLVDGDPTHAPGASGSDAH